MKRQIAAWALTGVMAVGHVADVQLPWHDDGPATTTTTTTLPFPFCDIYKSSVEVTGDLEGYCSKCCDEQACGQAC